MRVHYALNLHLGKKEHSKHCEDEQEQQQECPHIEKLWDGENEGLEDLLQGLGFFDKFEHSRNSERANNRGYRANVDCKNFKQ